MYEPKRRYEISLYDSFMELVQSYRTDSFDGIAVLIGQAIDHADYLGIEKNIRSSQKEIFANFEEVESI